jgi:hypothetical protein
MATYLFLKEKIMSPTQALLPAILITLFAPAVSFGQASGAGKDDFHQDRITDFTINYVQRRMGADNHPTTVDMTITTGKFAIVSSDSDEGMDESITESPMNPVPATADQIRQRWQHGYSKNDLARLERVVFPAVKCGDVEKARQGMKDFFADVRVTEKDPTYICNERTVWRDGQGLVNFQLERQKESDQLQGE